jgi:hypothetical protein
MAKIDQGEVIVWEKKDRILLVGAVLQAPAPPWLLSLCDLPCPDGAWQARPRIKKPKRYEVLGTNNLLNNIV